MCCFVGSSFPMCPYPHQRSYKHGGVKTNYSEDVCDYNTWDCTLYCYWHHQGYCNIDSMMRVLHFSLQLIIDIPSLSNLRLECQKPKGKGEMPNYGQWDRHCIFRSKLSLATMFTIDHCIENEAAMLTLAHCKLHTGLKWAKSCSETLTWCVMS